MGRNKHKDKPDHIKSILAVDPGMTSMGWAYAHTNLNNGEFIVHNFGIIKPANLANKEKEYRHIVEASILKADIVECEYRRLVHKFKSDYHVSEGAFFNMRSPNAYGSLSIVINTMKVILFEWFKTELSKLNQPVTQEEMELIYQRYKLRLFAPRAIKKTVATDGTSDKIKMQSSILNNSRIQFATSLEKPLIEHEADAIGAAYTFAQELPVQLFGTL